jgi:hypothetical protein
MTDTHYIWSGRGTARHRLIWPYMTPSWPQADRPLYARMGKSRLCPARACGRLFYINRAGDRSAHLPSAPRIDEPIDLLVNLAGSLTKRIANVARRLHEGVVVGKSEVSAFTYSQLVRAFPP